MTRDPLSRRDVLDRVPALARRPARREVIGPTEPAPRLSDIERKPGDEQGAGSNDPAVPIHHAKMLHDGITGSQLVIVDGADHALIWTHPEELVRVTEEFLGA